MHRLPRPGCVHHDLLVRNGIACGEAQTSPTIGKLPYPNLLIDGRKVADVVTGIFYGYVGGRKTKFAAFTLTAHSDDRVTTVTEEPLGIFPKSAGGYLQNGPLRRGRGRGGDAIEMGLAVKAMPGSGRLVAIRRGSAFCCQAPDAPTWSALKCVSCEGTSTSSINGLITAVAPL